MDRRLSYEELEKKVAEFTETFRKQSKNHTILKSEYDNLKKHFNQSHLDLSNANKALIEEITERKRVEEALVQNRKKLKVLSQQTERFSLAAASMITMNDEKDIFNKISSAIIEHSDFSCLIISYFKDPPPYRDIIGHGGIDEVTIEKLKTVEAPKSLFYKIFDNSIKFGQFSYLFPHTKKGIINQDIAVYGQGTVPESDKLWHPEDMLFIKMSNEKGKLVGVISVDSPRSVKRISNATVRPLEIFSNLISQIIIYRKAQEELKKAKIETERINKKLVSTNKNLEQVTQKLRYRNQEIESDLKMAHEIQMAFLEKHIRYFPENVPIENSALQFNYRYFPATTLAGDFFNIFPISKDKVGVLICDVMGHGVRASLLTTYIYGLVEELMPIALDSGAFMKKLNFNLNKIIVQSKIGLFVTAFYLVVDISNRRVIYTNAGHPPPFILEKSDGIIKKIKCNGYESGPALGLLRNYNYTIYESHISDGDILFFFTDGLYEVEAPDGQFFGRERLLQSIQNNVCKSSQRMIDGILAEIQGFSKSEDFRDDVCLVTMHYSDLCHTSQ